MTNKQLPLPCLWQNLETLTVDARAWCTGACICADSGQSDCVLDGDKQDGD